MRVRVRDRVRVRACLRVCALVGRDGGHKFFGGAGTAAMEGEDPEAAAERALQNILRWVHMHSTRVRTDTHAYMCTCTHTHACTCLHLHTCTPASSRLSTRARRHTFARAHACGRVQVAFEAVVEVKGCRSVRHPSLQQA